MLQTPKAYFLESLQLLKFFLFVLTMTTADYGNDNSNGFFVAVLRQDLMQLRLASNLYNY